MQLGYQKSGARTFPPLIFQRSRVRIEIARVRNFLPKYTSPGDNTGIGYMNYETFSKYTSLGDNIEVRYMKYETFFQIHFSR